MNHDDSHRELLDDLYPAAGVGPDSDIVLGMVRAHHAARRRRRSAGILGLLVTVGAVAFLLRGTTPPAPPLLVAKSPPPIRHLNDDELLDMFPGQPAAIATLPDGTQRLLLVVRATH
jgi:hypothetical protein